MTRLARGKGCRTGKVKYERRSDARKAARNLTGSLGRMNPYRCPLCRWYHIGHPKEDIVTGEIETEAGEPAVVEESPQDRILRTLWPYNPTAFGIRVLTAHSEVLELKGLEAETADALGQYMEQGWHVLMVEADPHLQARMLSILTNTVHSNLAPATAEEVEPDGRSDSEDEETVSP